MTIADRCPGVLRPHPAEDGMLIRLRLPGGQSTGEVLAGVARLAEHYGNGEVQLTTRAGLQIRGLPNPVPAELVGEIAALGLLPSAAHDRVRNILASPLTGVARGRADLRAMISDLDQALVADAELADLPGRFLFALDDGAGDVSELPFDLGYLAEGPDRGAVLVGSPQARVPVAANKAVETLVELARAFLGQRRRTPGRVWHVRDLPGWAASRARQLIERVPRQPAAPALGAVAGAASVLVPLGQLTPRQAAVVTGVAGCGPLVITPWRGVIIPGAAARLTDLIGVGLVADTRSGWALVSACVGAPHCARTAIDTRAVATGLVLAGDLTERVHVSGCERRCGAPSVPHRELVPT